MAAANRDRTGSKADEDELPAGESGPDDSGWNERQRGEKPLERLDRNWLDLLQELRVVQTGVQILTGFLVTLPFQSRFEDMSRFQTAIYLVTLCLSVLAMGFLVAPVSLHRMLFRRHARRVTVDVAHRLAQIGIVFLGASVIGVVVLIFDFVVSGVAAAIAATVAGLVLLGLWAVLPLIVRERHSDVENAEEADG
jgi:hypothetical protein